MVELIRRTHAGLHEIDDDFAMNTDYDLEVRKDLSIDYDLNLRVRYDEESMTTVLHSLEVYKRRGGREVRGAGLRNLRLQDYLRATQPAVWMFARGAWRADPGFDEMLADARSDAPAWRDSRLKWVYRVYRVAELAMLNPAQEVERRLELNPRTATRWIREARDAGLFAERPVVRDASEVTFGPEIRRMTDRQLHGDD